MNTHRIVARSHVAPVAAASLCLGIGLTIALSAPAFAATGGGTGTLPWDGPLGALTGFLTGSVAKYISIIAIFVAGLALIFGEDLGQFARRLLMIVIAIAFLVGAGSFATTFIGSTSGPSSRMAGPARSPVRQSLLRPQLVLGGERTLVLASGMLAAVLIFSLGSVTIGALGVGFWLLALAVLRRMAKHDPELSRVYIRHVNKRVYYPAHPHISALDPEIKHHQKG